jgi:hypothetical protein
LFQNHILALSVDLNPFLISASDIPVAVLIDDTVCVITVSSSAATEPPTVGEDVPPALGNAG